MPETSLKPRIALGSDHAGFHIKETIRQFLDNSGGPVNDPGTWPEEAVDSPDSCFSEYPVPRRVETDALVDREESKKHWQKQEKR